MAVNLRIITNLYSDDGTISATSAERPAANLQDSRRGKVWRSTSTAAQELKGTFDADRLVSAVILWRNNLSSDATWRIRFWDGQNQTGTLVHDSGTQTPITAKALGDLIWGIDPLGASIFTNWSLAFSTYWFTAVTARSWQIDLADASNADGYMEAARLVIGPYLSTTYNAEFGAAIEWEDNSIQERTDAGSIRVTERVPNRRLTLDFGLLQPNERSIFMEMGRAQGKRKNVFVSLFPTQGGSIERDYSMVANIENNVGLSLPFYDTYTSQLTFVEA